MNWSQASFLASASEPSQFPSHHRYEIALAGRSNVGKSSLINRLVQRRQLAAVSQAPGRTRTLNFYAVGDELCLVDLPGYGYARVSQQERQRWKALIETYLTRRRQLVGVILVVDVRHAPTELDHMMARWLRETGLPALVAATKADKIARGRWQGRSQQLARELGLPVILFSAETGVGQDHLRQWIELVLTDAALSRTRPSPEPEPAS